MQSRTVHLRAACDIARSSSHLRVAFAFVTFVGAALGLWVSPATWYVGLAQLLLVLTVPAFAVVCAVCFTGRARAASIGIAAATSLPAVSHILEFIQNSHVFVSENGRTVRIEVDVAWGVQGATAWFSDVLFLWALTLAVAAVCVVLHSLLPEGMDKEPREGENVNHATMLRSDEIAQAPRVHGQTLTGPPRTT